MSDTTTPTIQPATIPERAAGHIPLDAYYTPLPLARAIVARLPVPPCCACLEPSVGSGAFVQALYEIGICRCDAVDIDPEAHGLEITQHRGGATYAQNFLEFWGEHDEPYDFCIGNPPYQGAEDHVERALELAHHVAFLLRLGFLASARRCRLFQLHPVRRLMVLVQRPSFIRGKRARTDRYDYAVFCWGEAFEPGIEWISWR